MTEQEQRIARMEEAYDRCAAATGALLQAGAEYAALLPFLRELEAYYLGPLWRADFDADREGAIPRDMKRGILTEDAIWDLLTDQTRLRQLLEQILGENL